MFALGNVSPDMRTRKITMECHVLSYNIVIPHSDYEAMTEVACQGWLTVIEWTPRIGWIVVCRLTWVTWVAFIGPWSIHGRWWAGGTVIVEVTKGGNFVH